MTYEDIFGSCSSFVVVNRQGNFFHSNNLNTLAGCLTLPLVQGKFDVVLLSLIKTTKITPDTTAWAQTRRQAISSIIRLVETVGIKKDGKGLHFLHVDKCFTYQLCIMWCHDSCTMESNLV